MCVKADMDNIILRCSNAEIQNREVKKELLDLYSVNEKLLIERNMKRKSIAELNKLI